MTSSMFPIAVKFERPIKRTLHESGDVNIENNNFTTVWHTTELAIDVKWMSLNS